MEVHIERHNFSEANEWRWMNCCSLWEGTMEKKRIDYAN
jgi:hypothetical protein